MTGTGETIAPDRASGLYRKKPVVIEARQLADDLASHSAIAAWIEAGGGYAGIPFAEPCLYIETLEGRMRADIGDWVIKGVKGEFHPVKDDIFEATYEPADGAPPPDRDALAALAAKWAAQADDARPDATEAGEVHAAARHAAIRQMRICRRELLDNAGLAEVADEDAAWRKEQGL